MQTQMAGLALGILALTAHISAQACTVDEETSLAACFREVRAGEDILLEADGQVFVDGSLALTDKDIHIRSVDPDRPATLVHRRPGGVGLPDSRSPVPGGAIIAVPAGRTLQISDVHVELYSADPQAPDITLSRLLRVEGNAVLKKVRLAGFTGFNAGLPTSLPGGHLALVQGSSASLSLDSVEVESVRAPSQLGGAIFVANGAKLIVDGASRFTGCEAWQGGAIFARFGAEVIVRNQVGRADGGPVFQSNAARAYGGAIAVTADASTAPTLSISDARFSSNSSFDKGGQISSFGAPVSLEDVDVTDGTAKYGAGLYVRDADLTVATSTFSRNVAEIDGGAIDAFDAKDVGIGRTRFTANVGGRGAAIYTSTPQEPVSVRSNLFCANQADDGNDVFVEGGGSTVSFSNNLVDGQRKGRGESVAIRGTPYIILQNTFVRVPSETIGILGASGSIRRNAFGWNDGFSEIFSDTAVDFEANVFSDRDMSWDDGPTKIRNIAEGEGPAGVIGSLGITGTRGDGVLPDDCTTWAHHLRPDSNLLDAAWDSATIQTELRGHLGGSGAFTLPGFDAWSDDDDGDRIIAIWDCDDSDDQLDRLCETPGVDTDDPGGDTDDTDDGPGETDGPTEPEIPEELFWYGSCSTMSARSLAFPMILGLVLVARRRRERSLWG